MTEKTLKENKKAIYKFGKSEIDLNTYIHNLGTNLQSYMRHKNWNEGQQQEFVKVYDRFLAGLNDLATNNTNRFSSNDAGSIFDASGEFSNKDNDDIDPTGSEYYYDSSGNRIATGDFNLLKEKKLKNYSAFSANRELASYFNTVGQALRSKTPPKTLESNKFDFKKHGFIAHFSKTYSPTGEAIDPSLFSDKDAMGKTTILRENLGSYINSLPDLDYSDTAFGNKDTFKTKLLLAYDKLANGYNSDTAIALSLAGISGDLISGLFKKETPTEEVIPKGITAEEWELTKLYTAKQETERLQKLKDLVNEPSEREKNEALTKSMKEYELLGITNTKGIESRKLPELTYNSSIMLPELQLTALANMNEKYPNIFKTLYSEKGDVTYFGNDKTSATPGEMLANTLDLYFKLKDITQSLERDPNNIGSYIVPESLDFSSGVIRSYNPKTREVYTLPAYKTESGRQMWKDWYEAQLKKYNDPTWSKKDGGIIIAQNGLSMEEFSKLKSKERTNLLLLKAEDLRNLRNTKLSKPLSKPLSGLQTKEGLRKPYEDFSGTDIARLTSVGLDIASMISSYAPGYGTVASAITGVASTAATLGADLFEDGFLWRDLGNATIGLGADAVGLIPGWGSAGKANKIVRLLVRYAPRVMLALLAKNALSEEARASWSKIGTPSELTVDDWRNIGSGITAFAGVNRMAAGLLKTNAMKRVTKTGDNIISDKTGELLRVTPEQLETIRNAKSLKEANETLLSIKGHEGKELGSLFLHGLWGNISRIWNHQPTVDEYYDYSKLRETLFDKGINSDASLYQASKEGKLGKIIPSVNIHINNPYKVKTIKPLEKPKVTPKSKEPKRPSKFVIGLDKAADAYADFLINTARLARNLVKPVKKTPTILTTETPIKKLKPVTPNKEKRTGKRENGGTLDLSLVRRFKDGKNITNTTSTADWFTHMYNSEPMKSYFGSITKNNYKDFNGLLTMWSKNRIDTGYNPVKPSPISFNLGVQDRQKLWNLTNDTNSIMEDLSTNGIIRRFGNSGDNANGGYKDGLFGGLEYLRHGGTKESWDGSEEDLKLFLGEMAKRGLNYSLDHTSNMYLLSPIEETSTVKNIESPKTLGAVFDPLKVSEPPVINNTSESGALSGIFNNPTVMYGLPRAMYTNKMNRKMADMSKDAAIPLLKDPILLLRTTRSDLDAEIRGELSYATVRNMASKPISSDANILLAMLLEAELKGSEAINAGKALSNQVQRQYSELAWLQEKENANNRHETAMFNRDLLYKINLRKSLIEQAYLNLKHTTWDTFAQLLEFDARTKQSENKEIERSFALSDINSAITDNLGAYAKEAGILLSLEDEAIWDAINSGTRESSSLTNVEQLAYQRANKIASQIKQNLLANYLNIGKNKWSNIRNIKQVPYTVSTTLKDEKGGVLSAKDGSKVAVASIKARTADAERFQKQIKETIEKNEKTLDKLAKSLQEIIKSSTK